MKSMISPLAFSISSSLANILLSSSSHSFFLSATSFSALETVEEKLSLSFLYFRSSPESLSISVLIREISPTISSLFLFSEEICSVRTLISPSAFSFSSFLSVISFLAASILASSSSTDFSSSSYCCLVCSNSDLSLSESSFQC